MEGAAESDPVSSCTADEHQCSKSYSSTSDLFLREIVLKENSKKCPVNFHGSLTKSLTKAMCC